MQAYLDRAVIFISKFGVNIVAAILIVFIGRWAARLIADLTEKVLIKSKVEKTLASFVKNVVFMALMAFIVIAALGKLGIQTASFIAVVGAAGLAIGMALQGSLANLAAGVLLILFQPFKVGDDIEAAGAAGIVKEIEIFTTIIDTKDNKKVIIPNAKITADKIVVIKK